MMRILTNLTLLVILHLGLSNAQTSASEVVAQSGITGGIIVHVGCLDASFTKDLRIDSRFMVEGLDTSLSRVLDSRAKLRESGVGNNVMIRHLVSAQLPYRSGFVNLVVVDAPELTTTDEIMRVLCPGGAAMIRESNEYRKVSKSRPAELDDWTHFRHDAGNNPVSKDEVVDFPEGIQWIGSPERSRSHHYMSSFMAMVSSAGRVFYMMDEAPAGSIFFPSQWRLTARDAFNGHILWSHNLADWEDHLIRFKQGPVNKPQQLVATPQWVFVPLGDGSPVSVLDAITGEILSVLEGTENATEMVFLNGILYTGWEQMEAGSLIRGVTATRISGGITKLWSKEIDYFPNSLAAYKENLYVATLSSVECMKGQTGESVWSQPTEAASEDAINSFFRTITKFSAGLLVSEDIAIYAMPLRGQFTNFLAYNALTGVPLWRKDSITDNRSLAPTDMFVDNGVLWTDGEVGGKSALRAWNLHTGELIKELSLRAEKSIDNRTNHTCSRDAATVRMLLENHSGLNLIGFNGELNRNAGFTRGACVYGIMPANGILYAPQSSCICNMESRVTGLCAHSVENALSTITPHTDADRTIKGPAFGWKGNPVDETREWPTYRHNPARLGFTSDKLNKPVHHMWKVKLGKTVTPPTVAGNMVFAATRETHTLHALNASTGEIAWRFTAGGSIDSPPTIYQGLVIFGSTNGWVYALRLIDGELVWKHLAAPADASITAWENLESIWPVHGSVLVIDGSVYCSSGRSIHQDGGIRMVRLNALTGELEHTSTLGSTVFVGNKEQRIKENNTGLTDILSYSNNTVYMRSLPLTQQFERKIAEYPTCDIAQLEQHPEKIHLYSTTGFLDAAWHHRSYWLFSPMFGAATFFHPYCQNFRYPSGRILCAGNDLIWGFRFDLKNYAGKVDKDARWAEHHLYAMKMNAPDIVNDTAQVVWKKDMPLLVRAMTATSDALIISGPADVCDESPDNPQRLDQGVEQSRLFSGEGDGILMSIQQSTGNVLSTDTLPYQSVFDGMAVAYGHIYMSTTDGSVACLGDGPVSVARPADRNMNSERTGASKIFLKSVEQAIQTGRKVQLD